VTEQKIEEAVPGTETVVEEQEPVATESTEECTEEIAQEQPIVVEEEIVADADEEVAAQEEGEITEQSSEQVSSMPVTEDPSIATSPVPESMPQSEAVSAVDSDAAVVEKEDEPEAEMQKPVMHEDSSSVVSSSAVPENVEWPASSEINTSTDAVHPIMKENIEATA